MNAEWRMRRLLVSIVAVVLSGVVGCGSSIIPAITGGGLPPGELDIGGVVLTESDAALASDGATAGAPVPGATVRLMRGTKQVGSAVTGATGHFGFQAPPTANYRVEVTPPTGSGLMGAQRRFHHQRGEQTFLSIVLDRDAGG